MFVEVIVKSVRPMPLLKETQVIKIRCTKYVVYGVSNPVKTGQFMTDFGLVRVDWQGAAAYFRGALSSPYIYVAEPSDTPSLKAIGLEVESAEDLARASEIDGASEVRALDRPGGGRRPDLRWTNLGRRAPWLPSRRQVAATSSRKSRCR